MLENAAESRQSGVRRPHDENVWFVFNSPPELILFFVSGTFFEDESLAGRLFHLLQLTFRRVRF